MGAICLRGNPEAERGFIMSAFHELKLEALNGGELPLAPFKGQVVLNTEPVNPFDCYD